MVKYLNQHIKLGLAHDLQYKKLDQDEVVDL